MHRIYKVINLVNHRVYIGRTERELDDRLQFQFHKARHMKRKDNDIYEDMRNQPKKDFVIELLEETEDIESAKSLEEKYTLEAMDSGSCYNRKVGDKLTDEIRSNISKALKGNPKLATWKGKKQPKSMVEKRSTSLTGKVRTREQKARMSKAQKGKSKSESHKMKLAESLRGHKQSEDQVRRKSKSVYCKELDTTFKSASEASRETGVSYSAVKNLARLEATHKGKNLSFSYVETKEEINNDTIIKS